MRDTEREGKYLERSEEFGIGLERVREIHQIMTVMFWCVIFVNLAA